MTTRPRPLGTDYRYPTEHAILLGTGLLVAAVIALTSAATVCGSAVFVAVMLGAAYFANQAHHRSLMRQAHPVTAETLPDLHSLVQATAQRLGATGVATYVAPVPALNAYTFGLSDPKVVVLYAGLFKVLDGRELQFIIGHEMGHLRLGHTVLNSLLGGMAGIPSPYLGAVALYFAFRSWNRACEFSADRAGLLACGSLAAATSALVKIATRGAARSTASQAQALETLARQDEALAGQLGELLSTHPLIANRIEELRKYAASAEYRRLSEGRG